MRRTYFVSFLNIKGLYSQKAPHNPPLGASYGVSVVSFWEKSTLLQWHRIVITKGTSYAPEVSLGICDNCAESRFPHANLQYDYAYSAIKSPLNIFNREANNSLPVSKSLLFKLHHIHKRNAMIDMVIDYVFVGDHFQTQVYTGNFGVDGVSK